MSSVSWSFFTQQKKKSQHQEKHHIFITIFFLFCFMKKSKTWFIAFVSRGKFTKFKKKNQTNLCGRSDPDLWPPTNKFWTHPWIQAHISAKSEAITGACSSGILFPDLWPVFSPRLQTDNPSKVQTLFFCQPFHIKARCWTRTKNKVHCAPLSQRNNVRYWPLINSLVKTGALWLRGLKGKIRLNLRGVFFRRKNKTIFYQNPWPSSRPPQNN